MGQKYEIKEAGYTFSVADIAMEIGFFVITSPTVSAPLFKSNFRICLNVEYSSFGFGKMDPILNDRERKMDC